MSEFVRVCGKADLLPEGQVRELQAGNTTLCVANVNGVISAVGNVCPHRGGPLGQGTVEDGHVVCPWHGWAFSLESGICSHNPHAAVETYAVKVMGEDVFVKL